MKGTEEHQFEECCVLPTVTIVAIIMLLHDWEHNAKVQHFLHETPVSTNYLIETDHDWHLGAHQKLYKILPKQRTSHVDFDHHIHLPNLNDHCHLGLSREQALELKEFDESGIFDWSKVPVDLSQVPNGGLNPMVASAVALPTNGGGVKV